MKNLLTTITLLCFSVAANADIYFCVAERYGEVNLSDGRILEKEFLYEIYNTIIDTERGFKTGGNSSVNEYEGNCTKSSSLIVCQYIEEFDRETVLIDLTKRSLEYSRVTQSTRSFGADEPVFSGEVGTCTKA